MDSISKTKLTVGQINELTQNAFGSPAVSISENDSGYFGALYFVTLPGREAVLKTGPTSGVKVMRYEKDIMRAEVDALRLVRARSDVPAPEALFYDASRKFGDFEYFFMEKLNGADLNAISPQLTEGQKSEIMFEVGQLNKRINDITGEKFGLLAQPDKQSADWETAFKWMIGGVLADGRDAGVGLPLPYSEVEGIIAKFLCACAGVTVPKLVHWDLWPGNILVGNGKITGIVDWERALWADPLMEYGFWDKPPNKDYCAGYGMDFAALDKNARIRRALYDLYLSLILKIECRYRRYEDSPQNKWSEEVIISSCKAFESM
ncbi:MAG: aminoglycoside phosphotransferase family protein [Defluviitaleaceae bacterium]|nr:aminoglycoside phosphotransferase family protein [Defluviitaleaceae bacterium]